MNYFKIITIFFSLLPGFILAQVVKVNAENEKIVEFSDGSWRYFQLNDSIFESKELLFISAPNPESTPFEKPVSDETKSEKNEQTILNKKTENNRKSTLAYSDLMLKPPPYQCKITFSGVDEYSKKKRTDLASEIIFTYTSTEISKYLKDRDYVTCEARISEFIGDLKVLNLKIIVSSRTAKREYGYIKNDSYLNIKLLNGESVSLPITSADGGIIKDDNSTEFKASFALTRENEKLLIKYLVDKIRIVYLTGYEEYPVQNLDFFQNQITCLDNL